MSNKDNNKGGGRRPGDNSVRLGDLLSPETQAVLKRTRDGLPEGWGELFCLPGEIVMSVVADPGGTVYMLNGLLAFSGGEDPQILQAGFRSPVSGEWLDATERARTKFLSRQKRPAALMALPIDNVDLVPANAPDGTRETSLKIRWVADGSIVIYSLDRQKFSREMPWFHRDTKKDPMFRWFEMALQTLGAEMLISATAKYSKYARGLEPSFAPVEAAAKPVVDETVVRAPAEGTTSDWDNPAVVAPEPEPVKALSLDEEISASGGIDAEDLAELADGEVPGERHDLNLPSLLLSIPGATDPSAHKFDGLPDGQVEEGGGDWASVPVEEELPVG